MNKSLLLTVSFTLALAGCQKPEPQNHTPVTPATPSGQTVATSVPLNESVNKYTVMFLQAQPTLSSMLAVPPNMAGGIYNNRFPDYSGKGMRLFQQSMATGSAEIKALDTADLPEKLKTHQQIVVNILDYYTGFNEFSAGYIDTWGGHLPYVINQISGPLIDTPKLMQVQQSVSNAEEAQHYLTRLETMDKFVDKVLSKYREDMQNGIILPKNLHPKTLAYFDSFLSAPAAEHELVKTFAKKLENVTTLSETEKQTFIKQATQHVETVVYPAYERAKSAVQESQKVARNSDGIWSQPNGEQFYQHAIRFLADSSLTANEIHQIGLNEVARISNQMDTILSNNGFEKGTVGERMVDLAKMPVQLFADSDQGRADLLNYISGEIDTIMSQSHLHYGVLPTQAVEVRRIPPVSEAGEAGGFYSPPSLDGSRPGIYWINLRDMAAVPKFGLKTLTYHEAVPGHHFQIALNMAQQDIGLLRQNAPYNAYVEGWALYSEFYAATEMGMYQDDPTGDLGRLQAELYRAVRLVVDTGLHAKKWTRQQAIDYFHTTTGTSLSDVVPEVERYMAWPGQALGYKLGMLEFERLYLETKAALGENFDVKAFHDVILLAGARPISLVKADIKQWVAEKQAAEKPVAQ